MDELGRMWSTETAGKLYEAFRLKGILCGEPPWIELVESEREEWVRAMARAMTAAGFGRRPQFGDDEGPRGRIL